MSMYRQLYVAIILCTLLALVGSLLASVLSTRAYLSEQLRMKNMDNATVIALSISQKDIDAIDLELVVASLFDNGHYASIKILSPDGVTIVERHSVEEFNPVPDWFKRLFPIISVPGLAQINSKWTQIGTIQLISQNGNAYQTLWNSSREMVAALSMSAFIAAYLATLVLRRLKKPLQKVIEQAQGLSERRFIINEEPNVPELRQLTNAMNSAANLLKNIFADEAKRIETLRQMTNTDSVTGLANRTHFMSMLLTMMEAENAPPGGLIILRAQGLSELNQHIGRAKTDELLKKIGRCFVEHQCDIAEGFSARLNGTDFALLTREPNIQALAQRLFEALSQESFALATALKFYIGYSQYEYGMAPGSLLAQIDVAIATAESNGLSSVCGATPLNIEHMPKTNDDWSKLILRALSQNWVKLEFFPVLNKNGLLDHKESALRLMFGGKWFPAGRFFPIAERLGLSARLDLIGVKLALEELQNYSTERDIAVNLSIKSLQNADFRSQLRLILASKPLLAKNIWFEVSENSAYANVDTIRTFHRDVQAFGCKIGLEHFGKQFVKINLLHELQIHFVKIDASFVRGIENNTGNQEFVKGISNIIHRLGMQVFAEGINTEAEMQALLLLDLDGLTGPAIGRSLQE